MNNDKVNNKLAVYNMLKRTAVLAAIFSLLVCVFFILNYFQLKSNDPLNSPALTKLYADLDTNPNDDVLRQQIRSLDLLARKAYFTKQWQINFGGYILFAGIVVLFVCLKLMSELKQKTPELPQPVTDTWENRLLSQKWVMFSGIIVLSVTVALALLTQKEMSAASFERQQVKKYKVPDEKDILKNWPYFRGPYTIGYAAYSNVPQTWDGESGVNILWKTPVPKPGFNSPVFWDNKIFLSGADENTEEVYCFDDNSGQIIWQRQVTGIPGSPSERPDVTEDTGYAAPTMAVDGSYVYAVFATGNLVCFDVGGNKIWGKNLGVPDNHYGHSSSLIVDRGLLLIQYDHGNGASVMGLDAATGKTVWQVQRDMGITWSSPILVNTGKRMELILSANPFVVSYDPKTGNELWRVDCMGGEVASSPAYADGIVYAANENAILAAIQLGDTPEIIWEHEDDLPDASSPVATKEYLILSSGYGAVTCLDAKTGSVYWLHDFDNGFYSSPILVGENVYLMDLYGNMQIFKADKTFSLVNTAQLGEDVSTIPVFADKKIFIRGSDNLYCIGEK
ncbi:PQQ-binding-like beta-propeller repeat protein [candidate division KSB1 bacterium]|nr:PQQ-binding-like beta-propeller repeat protein [candidate division KSB1 bacterium]